MSEVWEKNTESKNPMVLKTKNRKIMVSSNCVVGGGEEQETCGLLLGNNSPSFIMCYSLKV